MKVLIFTDHETHGSSNSYYSLANALFEHEDIQLTTVTRGDLRNEAFFEGQDLDIIGYEHSTKVEFPMHLSFFEASIEVELNDFDIIFLRLPRPIAPEFFDFLTTNFPNERIINSPKGIKKTSNKSYLLNLDKFIVPMRLCTSILEIEAFKNEYDCVLKPLEEYGGKGIVKIIGDQVSLDDSVMSFIAFAEYYKEYSMDYLAMKFLKNVSNGDKRIVVANGQILTSSLRLPKEGGWLCNIAQGGTGQLSDPTDRELEVVKYLTPLLAKEGIFYFGLDTLEDDHGDRVISEINTLSVGGIAPAEVDEEQSISKRFADIFYEYSNSKIE